MPHSVTYKFKFDAAHRIVGHTGKCQHLHGHSYVAEVTVASNGLNYLGMVVDFSVLKERIGSWIDAAWDHNVILAYTDPLTQHLQRYEARSPYLMARPPTAEVMAEELAFRSATRLPDNVFIVQVTIWETDKAAAHFVVPVRQNLGVPVSAENRDTKSE